MQRLPWMEGPRMAVARSPKLPSGTYKHVRRTLKSARRNSQHQRNVMNHDKHRRRETPPNLTKKAENQLCNTKKTNMSTCRHKLNDAFCATKHLQHRFMQLTPGTFSNIRKKTQEQSGAHGKSCVRFSRRKYSTVVCTSSGSYCTMCLQLQTMRERQIYRPRM